MYLYLKYLCTYASVCVCVCVCVCVRVCVSAFKIVNGSYL